MSFNSDRLSTASTEKKISLPFMIYYKNSDKEDKQISLTEYSCCNIRNQRKILMFILMAFMKKH
jgi:hypothetical protein